MNIDPLLSRVSTSKVTLYVENGKLTYEGDKERVKGLLPILQEHKLLLLKHFSNSESEPKEITTHEVPTEEQQEFSYSDEFIGRICSNRNLYKEGLKSYVSTHHPIIVDEFYQRLRDYKLVLENEAREFIRQMGRSGGDDGCEALERIYDKKHFNENDIFFYWTSYNHSEIKTEYDVGDSWPITQSLCRPILVKPRGL